MYYAQGTNPTGNVTPASTLRSRGHGSALTRTQCPMCRRPFCVVCQVPWHTGVRCQDYKMRQVGLAVPTTLSNVAVLFHADVLHVDEAVVVNWHVFFVRLSIGSYSFLTEKNLQYCLGRRCRLCQSPYYQTEVLLHVCRWLEPRILLPFPHPSLFLSRPSGRKHTAHCSHIQGMVHSSLCHTPSAKVCQTVRVEPQPKSF